MQQHAPGQGVGRVDQEEEFEEEVRGPRDDEDHQDQGNHEASAPEACGVLRLAEEGRWRVGVGGVGGGEAAEVFSGSEWGWGWVPGCWRRRG